MDCVRYLHSDPLGVLHLVGCADLGWIHVWFSNVLLACDDSIVNAQDAADSERDRQEQEEQLWIKHYHDCKELESILDEMGVKHQKVKERKWI